MTMSRSIRRRIKKFGVSRRLRPSETVQNVDDEGISERSDRDDSDDFDVATQDRDADRAESQRSRPDKDELDFAGALEDDYQEPDGTRVGTRLQGGPGPGDRPGAFQPVYAPPPTPAPAPPPTPEPTPAPAPPPRRTYGEPSDFDDLSSQGTTTPRPTRPRPRPTPSPVEAPATEYEDEDPDYDPVTKTVADTRTDFVDEDSVYDPGTTPPVAAAPRRPRTAPSVQPEFAAPATPAPSPAPPSVQREFAAPATPAPSSAPPSVQREFAAPATPAPVPSVASEGAPVGYTRDVEGAFAGKPVGHTRDVEGAFESGGAVPSPQTPEYTWVESAGYRVPALDTAKVVDQRRQQIGDYYGDEPVAVHQDRRDFAAMSPAELAVAAKKAQIRQREEGAELGDPRPFYSKIPGIAADTLVPVLGTARHWDKMSPAQRALSLGLDVASVVPLGAIPAKAVRTGAGLGRGLKVAGKAGALGAFHAVRHPIEAGKSAYRFGDVVLGPKTIPVSALESQHSTTRLGVKSFEGVDGSAVPSSYQNLDRHLKPSTVDHGVEAAAAAKFASDELTEKLRKGLPAEVEVGGVRVKMTPTPFQKATGREAVFSTGPDISPWKAPGGSRGFVSAEGVSFNAPGYLSRLDARSAFGRRTPLGGQAGAAAITDPEILRLLRGSDKTYTPSFRTADELVEIENTLRQPLNYPEPSQILKTYSDPNVVRPGADAVDEYIAQGAELARTNPQLAKQIGKQTDELRKTGAVDFGRKRELAVIGDPVSLPDIYKLKLRGAAENVRRLNPFFKHTDIRYGAVDDVARAADNLAAQGSDDAAAFVRSRTANVRNVDDLIESSEDLARAGYVNEAAALRREADDVLRRLDDTAREASGASGVAGIGRGALSAAAEARDAARARESGLTRDGEVVLARAGERTTAERSEGGRPGSAATRTYGEPSDFDDLSSRGGRAGGPREEIIRVPPDEPETPRDEIITGPRREPPPPDEPPPREPPPPEDPPT